MFFDPTTNIRPKIAGRQGSVMLRAQDYGPGRRPTSTHGHTW
jgi:hypothetical protein